LREVYQKLDYVLIPATVEGGPMSLLEGLAMGKAIIAPENVGIIPEFLGSEHIRRYPAGDAPALVDLVSKCYQEKLTRNRLVQDRTSDRWAADHHKLFSELLAGRGLALPSPGDGFRFGMLGELDIPLDVDVEALEGVIDRAAAHIYFGRHREATSVLQEARGRYPFVQKLIVSIPHTQLSMAQGQGKRPHLGALR
jgi:hypothetical protein